MFCLEALKTRHFWKREVVFIWRVSGLFFLAFLFRVVANKRWTKLTGETERVCWVGRELKVGRERSYLQ